MKLITGLIATILVAAIAPQVAQAGNEPPMGRFSGGGYSIELGSGGDYVGSDRSRRRISIPSSRHRASEQTSEWENDGYIYRVTGLNNSLAASKVKPIKTHNPGNSTDYRQVALTIINPSGRIILYKILNNPRYGKK
jgi:hypothetical protein